MVSTGSRDERGTWSRATRVVACLLGIWGAAATFPDARAADALLSAPKEMIRAEAYRAVPMPRGVRVEATELDGPVFADSKGRTLYRWPLRSLRNGPTGDPIGASVCTDVRTEVTAGLMSPYPGGLRLPDLDQHLSCTQMWPPFRADARAKPVGEWTIIKRSDGTQQWAYQGYALYTSYLDKRPGDVFGGRQDKRQGDSPVVREPVGPPPDLPPGFAVKTKSTGRLLVTQEGYSVYSSDQDTPDKSNCDGACAETWIPLLAPASGQAHGDWTLVTRARGLKQWAFRNRPLYRYRLDGDAYKLKGSDVPGWHNVYTQRAPAPPEGFTAQETTAGLVLADPRGMTIYTYFCGDDGLDQLGCDHPSQTQAYRLTVCGGGDVERCIRTYQYVIAPANAKSTSRSWSVMTIDPRSGRIAKPGQPGALRVWAFRDRPIYTFAGDQPGDAFADGTGEFRGLRNGYRAFWLRDDFFNADQPGPG